MMPLLCLSDKRTISHPGEPMHREDEQLILPEISVLESVDLYPRLFASTWA